MADDVAMPSNPLVTLVKKEELKEASLDMNVFQRSCEEESCIRVVRTRIDHLAWDCRLSPNSHALAIYLKFVPAYGVTLERFEKCKCEDAMFVFIVKLGFLVMAIIIGYKAQSTPFLWSIEPNI
jgi:hypothetical protein